MTDLQEIFSEWQNNPAFREAFKNNPEQALKDAGFVLSQDDLKKIKARINLDQASDQKLDDRISK